VSAEIETRVFALDDADVGAALWEDGFVDVGGAVEDEDEIGGGV